MEKSKKLLSAEELLRKIQDLEARQARIHQEINKLVHPKPERSNSKSPCPRLIGGVMKPLSLKLTEGQYLNVLQSMGQAIHIFDLKHRIYFWSRAAEKLYGLTAAEAIGKTPTEILVDPKDAVLADYLLERTVNGESWSGEFPVTNKRETFLVVCTNTPFRDANRRLIGGICISSDSRPYQSRKPIKRIQTAKTNGDSEASIREHPYGVFTTGDKHKNLLLKAEEWIDKQRSAWPWKRNEREDKSHAASHFGWQSLYINPEEHRPQMSYEKSDSKKIDGPGLWLSTLRVTSTSSSSNDDSSETVFKDESERDNLQYEILWEDLIIKQQIGRGSCGIVNQGLWYGSDVAIKLFTYQECSDDVMISFKQEVSLMKRLRHPNVLLFMGAVTSPKNLCIVTEFLPRGSLFQILQRNSIQIHWKRRLRMAIDIALGMNYLHQCNPPVVHRDLKSSNLLVDKNWTVKVGDFGLSRIKHQTYLKTKSGKGTPQWMAPEIIRNEQADEKSDIYSYGVVLWELITEKMPWDDLNPMQVIAAVGFMNRRLEIPKDVDPLWASLIQSCWHSEPQSRPTFQEILYQLELLKKKFAAERKR